MRKKIHDLRVNQYSTFGVLAETPKQALKHLLEKLLKEDDIDFGETDSFEIELINADNEIPTEENPIILYCERD